MFLPTTKNDLKKLNWKQLDIIIVTGDTYIDSPFIGAAAIGQWLLKNGFKVGIIAQPDLNSDKDILRLGEPKLFWGITSGSVDSMVANYTSLNKKRKKDDFTPGGENNKRPDRAVIRYTNLVKQFSKGVPTVLGGIEASLRRVPHYDYWSNKIKNSILFDSKGDILVYGMGEIAILKIAQALKDKTPYQNIEGICYISKEIPNDQNFIELSPFEKVSKDKNMFSDMFSTFYNNQDPITAKGLYQKFQNRYLIHNPPTPLLTQKELDQIHDIKYKRKVHPFYQNMGKVKAQETIKYSVITHRGCYGECNFCAIAVHQGRTVQYRSIQSVVKEVEDIVKIDKFNGIISDLGGPTANMYGFECKKKLKLGSCKDRRCLYPDICPSLKIDHSKQMELLDKILSIEKIKKVFINSGVRYDLILNDLKNGKKYLKKLIDKHISGQMKVAPEHSEEKVLKQMGKGSIEQLKKFKNLFDSLQKNDKKLFLTYYLIAAHPGCSIKEMKNMRYIFENIFKHIPKQIQIFTPTPSTWSTLLYYLGYNPKNEKKVYVEKGLKGKKEQKDLMFYQQKIKKNNSDRDKNGKKYKKDRKRRN